MTLGELYVSPGLVKAVRLVCSDKAFYPSARSARGGFSADRVWASLTNKGTERKRETDYKTSVRKA